MEREKKLKDDFALVFDKLLSGKLASDSIIRFFEEMQKLQVGNEDIFQVIGHQVIANYMDRMINLISDDLIVKGSDFTKEEWKTFLQKDFEQKMQAMLIPHSPLQKTHEPNAHEPNT